MSQDDAETIYREWRRVSDIADDKKESTSKNGLFPSGRGGHCIVSMPFPTRTRHLKDRLDDNNNSIALLLGGGDRTGSAFGDVWEMEVMTNDRENKSATLDADASNLGRIVWKRARNQDDDHFDIPPRSGATSVCFESRGVVVIFGGQDPISGTCFNDIIILQRHELETVTDVEQSPYYWSWRRSQSPSGSLSPPPRHSHVCACVSDRLMVLFGGASQTHGLFNDVWVFDIDEETWSLKSTSGHIPSSREMAAAAVISDPSGSHINHVPHGNPSLSSSHDTFAIVIHGGRGEAGVLNDCIMLSLKDWSWTKLSGEGEAIKQFSRCAHCAASMGNNQLVCTSGFNGESICGETFVIDVESPTKATFRSLKSIRNNDKVARFAAAGMVLTLPLSCELSDKSSQEKKVFAVVGGVTEEEDLADVLILV